MGWSLVCEHNKDGVVVRWCINTNAIKIVEQDGYT